MRTILALLCITLVFGAFTEQEIEEGKFRSQMRSSVNKYASIHGLSFEQAKENMRNEVAAAPIGSFTDRVMMDKYIREASASDVNVQPMLTLGTATAALSFSGSNFYVYPFTVPSADSQLVMTLNAPGAFGSQQYAGVIYGLGRAVYDESDRYLSQWFFTLGAQNAAYTMPPCASKVYAGTTAYVWFYKTTVTSSWPGSVSFTLAATAMTCSVNGTSTPLTGNLASTLITTINAPTAGWAYASFSYSNPVSTQLTVTTIPASASGKITVAGGANAAGNGSPVGGYITNSASATISVAYNVAANEVGIPINLYVSSTAYTCGTLDIVQINQTCPQLTNNMKYARHTYTVTYNLGLLDLNAYFFGGGVCASGVVRTLSCTALFPQCDVNNFVLPICTSLCTDYAACSGYETQDKCFGYMQAQLSDEQDSTRSPTNTQYNPVKLVPATSAQVTVGTDCWRYPFNSGSMVAPSILVLVVLALLGLFL